MNRVGVVAWNTFREAVRDRVLYNLVFFALLMMAAAILVGQISIGIEQIVIVTLGLSAVSVIGLLMAVFIGVGLVSKEMDKRTLYALLAKPVRRWEFLLGKFSGLLLTLTVNTAAMAAGLFAAIPCHRPCKPSCAGCLICCRTFRISMPWPRRLMAGRYRAH
jgi:ABC-type transport system involved in multi-copper enzyme maturation permease subunit